MANYYWIVGATVQEQKMAEDFVKHGFWFGDKDTAQALIEKISVGDRMAIKVRLGLGAQEVQILAIGIVIKLGYKSNDFRFIFADWLDISGENRRVPVRNWLGTIHGPFKKNDETIKAVFAL